MSVSPDEFLRYLIDSGAFNQYNQQAIHALPIPKNDLSAVVLPAVSGGVDSDVSSWEYYQAHKKEIGEEYFDYLADLNAKGIISYPNEFLAWYSTQMQPYPLKTAFDDYRNCRASDNPYTAAYGGDAYLALIRRFPNGETHLLEVSHTEYIGVRGEPGELKHLSSSRKRHQPRFRK